MKSGSMGPLTGVSECGWPGNECQIWWEAWASVGTILAAVVTLLALLVALKTSRDALNQNRSIEDERRKLANAQEAKVSEAICRALHFETTNALVNRKSLLTAAATEARSPFSARTLILRLGLEVRTILKIAAQRAEILPTDISIKVFEDLAAADTFYAFTRPTGRLPDNIDAYQVDPIYQACMTMGADLSTRDELLLEAINSVYRIDER